MVKGIGAYFGNIQSAEGTYAEQQAILVEIFDLYGVKIQRKKVTIKNGVLCIPFTSGEKLAIMLKKDEILQKINAKLQPKNKIVDIK